jgi:hypothetical protein
MRRHPLLIDVWSTMDDLELVLECSSGTEEENNFYNEWTCDHYVSAVFISFILMEPFQSVSPSISLDQCMTVR